MKKCQGELCTNEAEEGMRFCKLCEKIYKDKMRSSGYLAQVPRQGDFRTQDQKENVRETKYGKGQG